MSRLFAFHCLHRFVCVKHTSSTNLECWFAQNTTAATEKSPCLELAHNILCKQNLAASDSPLASINLHENNNFTSNATSVWFWKIYISLKSYVYSIRSKYKISSLSTLVENHLKLPAFCVFGKVYRWRAKYCIATRIFAVPRGAPTIFAKRVADVCF